MTFFFLAGGGEGGRGAHLLDSQRAGQFKTSPELKTFWLLKMLRQMLLKSGQDNDIRQKRAFELTNEWVNANLAGRYLNLLVYWSVSKWMNVEPYTQFYCTRKLLLFFVFQLLWLRLESLAKDESRENRWQNFSKRWREQLYWSEKPSGDLSVNLVWRCAWLIKKQKLSIWNAYRVVHK